MSNVRGASRSAASGAEVPLLVVGVVLLLLVMAAYFRLQYRRQRRQMRRAEYLPPLQQAASKAGLLEQIAQRKRSLQRFITKLRSQLDDREQQLRAHDELESIVTSRAATSRQDDQEWRALMKAGRKLHGKKWTATDGDAPSLQELMETHKDELLEYKRSMETSGRARRSSRRESSQPETSRWGLASKNSSISSPVKPIVASAPRLVPPQWQSTRRLASSVRPVRGLNPTEPASKDDNIDAVHMDVPVDADASTDVEIPRLNLSKLRPQLPSASGDTHSSAATEMSANADGAFEAKFHRKTRLARMFSRRKA